MNDAPIIAPGGTSPANGKPLDPVGELRKRHEEGLSRVETRGRKPGTKAGVDFKVPSRPGQAASPSSVPSPIPAPTNEALNKKMGMVWRAVGYGLALSTNCSVWTLDEEQEKLLGEAYGDLCAHFGLTDTLAFKVVFCAGVTIGVMGSKAAVYANWRAGEVAKQEAAKKNLAGKEKTAPAPAPPVKTEKDGHAPPAGAGAS